jgi:hypothetical protein
MSLNTLEARVRKAKPIFLTGPDIKIIKISIMEHLSTLNTSNVEELKKFISDFSNNVIIRCGVITDILELAYKDPRSFEGCADVGQVVAHGFCVWRATCWPDRETTTSLDVRATVTRHYLNPAPSLRRSIDSTIEKQDGFLVEIELLTLLFAKLLLKFKLQISTPGLDTEIDALITLTGKFSKGSYLRNALCSDYSRLVTVIALIMFAVGSLYFYDAACTPACTPACTAACTAAGSCQYVCGGVLVLPMTVMRCVGLHYSYRYGVSHIGTHLKSKTAAQVWDEAEKIANDYIAPTYTPGNASGRPPSPPVYDENSPLITAQPQ